MKEDYEAHAQAQLASLKRDMRKTMEDATVRAVNKVMAEFEAKSDEQLMENAQGELERIKLVQTGVGIGKPEQEPVAWLITDEKINSLQVDSIQRLIDRARHAHMTDIKLRINGQDEWHQADWLKHLTRTTPPQRTWQGLTDEEVLDIARTFGAQPWPPGSCVAFGQMVEAKLKEKNA